MFYYIYLLLLSNCKYYAGHTENLKERLEYHNKGNVDATKNYLPAKLTFYAAFSDKTLAINFEKYLKSSSGFAFRNKRLINKI